MRLFAIAAIALLPSCAWMRPDPPKHAAAVAASGVSVRDLVIPEQGEPVRSGDTVGIHYDLWLADKTHVESSRQKGPPIRFAVGAGAVPAGLEEGIVGMKLYGKRRIVVPSELGYGAAGRPPQIPPDSTLTFDVELMEHAPARP